METLEVARRVGFTTTKPFRFRDDTIPFLRNIQNIVRASSGEVRTQLAAVPPNEVSTRFQSRVGERHDPVGKISTHISIRVYWSNSPDFAATGSTRAPFSTCARIEDP